jgi:DNA polymerase III delta subunit
MLMRYTSPKAFERHLAASAPHNFCHLYVVAVTDEYERKKILTTIFSYLRGEEPFLLRWPGAEEDLPQILEALSSKSLFGQAPIVLLEDAEKKTLHALEKMVKQPLAFGTLLIGTRCKEGILFEQHGVILDLLDEKPWEREKRWIEQLQEKARASGKRLDSDAAAWMMEYVEPNRALLAQELKKLLCFCASKPIIERIDVEAICVKSRVRPLWTIAEEMVWEQTFRLSEQEVRDSFHSLLIHLRQQCMIGAKMHELDQNAIPFSEWSPYFPKLWTKSLEKKAERAHRLDQSYFQKALELLFQIELCSKSTGAPLELLYDLLRSCFRRTTR